MHSLTVDFFDHITTLEASLCTRTTWTDVPDQCSFTLWNFESFCQIGSDFLDGNAQITASNFAVLQYLVHDAPRHVDRDGKPNSLIAATVAGQDRCIDPDKVSMRIDQRAA